VFVDDDSPDGTADLARELARAKPRVRCIQRIGRRGLSRAVIEGALSTSAPLIAVMDADLQHDEALLPRMLEMLRRGESDIVVASRYIEGGSIGDWEARRARMSRFATDLARRILKVELSDPMSGFFMLRRESFDAAARRLSGEGYKILLDHLASSPKPLKVCELPMAFRPRHAGASKMDAAVLWEFLLL
jgi:dolichol-phosphate mannosyltransferase